MRSIVEIQLKISIIIEYLRGKRAFFGGGGVNIFEPHHKGERAPWAPPYVWATDFGNLQELPKMPAFGNSGIYDRSAKIAETSEWRALGNSGISGKSTRIAENAERTSFWAFQ